MTRAVSNTPRTAVEQLLLSSAVDRALGKLELPMIRGRKVHISFEHLNAVDAEYIRMATRVRLAQIGGLLVTKSEEADYTVEVASGGLGTEYKAMQIGLPPLPMPNSPIPTPEANLYKTDERTGIFKLFIFVHQEGKFVASAHYYAKADRREHFILFWQFTTYDDIRTGWESADGKLHTVP